MFKVFLYNAFSQTTSADAYETQTVLLWFMW